MSSLSLNSKEIKHVLKKGKRVSNKYFLIFYLPSQSLKVSPVVSKKISKKAVVRNKIKRRVRHLAKELLSVGSFAIVVKKDISEIDFKEVRNELEKLICKIN